MPEDRSQRARARRREISLATSDLESTLNSIVERETVTGVSSGDGSAPTADTDDGDDLEVLEPYGFASRPDGDGTTLAVAPGADLEARVALGVSSPGGRPATDAGDTALWCVAGHTILLDNDDALTITSKDGSSIVLASSGAITITAGTAASITIDVDGGQSVNVGGPGAVEMLKAALAETFLAAAATFGSGAAVPNDGGKVALAQMALYITGTIPAPPPGLATAAGTTKAKGE
jgi:phage gp45-like